jgi:predicted dehydrogenase
MKTDKVLLVGFGSIGKFHLQKLQKTYKIVDIIEPDYDKHNAVLLSGSRTKINFYQNIENIENGITYEFAVIANWGPDHFETIQKLYKKGIHKFLIEKPLSDSLFELDCIEQMIKNKQIEIISHFQWSYSFLPRIIESSDIKKEIGNLISIVISGGAKCLVTNGIHFMALADILFGSEPMTSSEMYQNDFINPRSKSFLYLEGNVTWKYPNSRYLSINFFNRSHNSIIGILNFEYGYAILENNNIKVFAIETIEKNKIVSKTTTKNATKEIYNGPAFTFQDGSDGTDVIYRKLQGEITQFDMYHGISVTKNLIASIIKFYNLEKSSFAKSIKEDDFKVKWNLS